jgi:hypothetical protein
MQSEIKTTTAFIGKEKKKKALLTYNSNKVFESDG